MTCCNKWVIKCCIFFCSSVVALEYFQLNGDQNATQRAGQTIGRYKYDRERKLGHRRVGDGGEITYKKIQSSHIMGSIQLGIQHTVSACYQFKLNIVNCKIEFIGFKHRFVGNGAYAEIEICFCFAGWELSIKTKTWLADEWFLGIRNDSISTGRFIANACASLFRI